MPDTSGKRCRIWFGSAFFLFLRRFILTGMYKTKIMEVKVKVDDQLVQSAFQLSGLGTQKEVVEEALKAFVQLLQQKSIKSLRGKLNWEGDLNEMRADQ
jgi:Arc/MetJ family transcription regulator